MAVLSAVLCLVIVLSFLPAQADQAPAPDDLFIDIPTSSLVYVSDYFSFVGQDSQGRVAFALDNGCGRDVDAYQAEHLLVLHDEKVGWVELKGNDRYDNNGKELKAIPNSPAVRFQGTPNAGMTIVSDVNRLTLTIEPVRPRSDNRHDGAVLSMGTASAVLAW